MKNFMYLMAFGLLCLSCQPEPDANKLYDELVVSTNYDPDVDFTSYTTFAMPTDTIDYVSETSNETVLVASESNFPRPVLEQIRANIESRGYTRVTKNENPDLGINVAVINDFNVFQTIVYPDPYYYPGNYYSGYYGYNSWYSYPYVSTQAYNTAVLVVEIVDLKNRTPDNKVKVIWAGYMGDLYSTLNLVDQARTAIDQAFQQSPYIGTQGGS
jgi:hypothetical protein